MDGRGSFASRAGSTKRCRCWRLPRSTGKSVSVTRALYVRESIDSRLPTGRYSHRVSGVRARTDSRVGFEARRRAARPSRRGGRLRSRASLRAFRLGWRRRTSGSGCDPDRRCAEQPRAPCGPRAASRVFRLSSQEPRAESPSKRSTVDGAVLAAREVRLPLVSGGIVARAPARRPHPTWTGSSSQSCAPSSSTSFEDRRWVQAHSLSPDAPYLPAPGPGVWRLQIRADLFSDNTAGVSSFVVDDPARPDRARAAATAVLEDADRRGLDPLALAVLDGALPGASGDDAIRALFAVPNFDVVAVGSG